MKRHCFMAPDGNSVPGILGEIEEVLEGARLEMANQAWIVIGSIHHINGIIKDRGNSYFIFLELPSERFVTGDNSVYISTTTLNQPIPYTIRSYNGDIFDDGMVVYSELFDDLRFDATKLGLVNKKNDYFSKEETLTLVPLFYISAVCHRFIQDGSVQAEVMDDISLYSQLRYSEKDIIFIQTAKNLSPIVEIERDVIDFKDALEGNPILSVCVEKHGGESLFLGNHQCYYRKLDKEYEIEYKLNLDHSARIWDLTAEIYSRIKSGAMPGYILEYKDEFQKWDYYNHLFEVTEPDDQRGYISFIPRTDGKFNVKRKVFKKDDLRRKESIRSSVKITGTLEEFLAEQFDFSFRRFPPFRRVRYDVNFESLHTGNVFGIFFDHISVEGRDECLVQCEIEYLRTRSLFDNQEYMSELSHIFDWTANYLEEKGLQYTKTYYSKLSFLRDTFRDTQ